MNIRDLTWQDIPSALELLDADQLPSQPRNTVRDVQRAFAGQATIAQNRNQFTSFSIEAAAKGLCANNIASTREQHSSRSRISLVDKGPETVLHRLHRAYYRPDCICNRQWGF